MIGKLFGKLFVLVVFYLLVSAFIYTTSYIALSKKKFINLPGFKSIQKNLYWNSQFGFVEVWQNKSDCIRYDKDLIYVPKIGSCKYKNAEFDTILNFTANGRLMPKVNNSKNETILVTGDSHAMGWGVNDNETFSHLLQSSLETQVYNLAVSSYGTVREVMRLNKSDLLKNSDILIIQYHENDIRENQNFYDIDKLKNDEKFSKLNESKNISFEELIKFIFKTYKSSLRLIFTDITGLFVKTKKEINFDDHYSVLLKELKNIKNFEEKKIIVFFSNGPEARFFNFPEGYDLNYKNVYFANIKLNKEDHFFLDQHPNAIGHRKIAIQLEKILKDNY